MKKLLLLLPLLALPFINTGCVATVRTPMVSPEPVYVESYAYTYYSQPIVVIHPYYYGWRYRR